MRDNTSIDYKQMLLDTSLKRTDVLYNRSLCYCNLSKFQEAMNDLATVRHLSEEYPQVHQLIQRIASQQLSSRLLAIY
jgi:hypothetical protein